MQRLGEKLHTLQKRQGLTQTQLGNMLGVDQSHIVKIEKGERMPEHSPIIPTLQHWNEQNCKMEPIKLYSVEVGLAVEICTLA